MASPVISTEALLEEGKEKFRSQFHYDPEWVGCAPGRVNLIGEHTDYNEGFVMPMALPFVTLVIGKKTESDVCRVLTTSSEADTPHTTEFCVPTEMDPLEPGLPKWANYVKGVVANFDGPKIGFDAVIASNVPFGAGLSSSASLEVAVYSFLEGITDTITTDLKQKAINCQKAEHTFANTPCGIMDQFVSVLGQPGHALFIDCRSLEVKNIPINTDKYVFLIINSNVGHDLANSEYAIRKDTCSKVADVLGRRSLRGCNHDQIYDLFMSDEINETEYYRARHVIIENDRVVYSIEAIRKDKYSEFGYYMNRSHYSLRVEYEVSCAEVDELVEMVQKLPGVLGSRMTGGGFGGCTVSLIEKQAVDNVIEKVKENYKGNASFYVAVPSEGAKCFQISSE